MIRLNIMKEAMDNECLAEMGVESLHGTRVINELVRLWEMTGRVFTADSSFASVPYCRALRGMGLRFIGVVKTTTREYPLCHLLIVELPQKGDYKDVLNILEDGYKLMVFVWVDI